MPVQFNQQSIPVNKDAIGNAWASVAAAAGKSYQLVSFSGGNTLIAGSLTVAFGTTTKLKYYAKSGNPISEYYGIDGPVTGTNQVLSVRFQNEGSFAKSCYANLLYRIVL